VRAHLFIENVSGAVDNHECRVPFVHPFGGRFHVGQVRRVLADDEQRLRAGQAHT
jgi:hypothetical protein